MSFCANCNRDLTENMQTWQTADGTVCDACLELYTDLDGALELPIKRPVVQLKPVSFVYTVEATELWTSDTDTFLLGIFTSLETAFLENRDFPKIRF